jgi:hypothetical protein
MASLNQTKPTYEKITRCTFASGRFLMSWQGYLSLKIQSPWPWNSLLKLFIALQVIEWIWRSYIASTRLCWFDNLKMHALFYSNWGRCRIGHEKPMIGMIHCMKGTSDKAIIIKQLIIRQLIGIWAVRNVFIPKAGRFWRKRWFVVEKNISLIINCIDQKREKNSSNLHYFVEKCLRSEKSVLFSHPVFQE